MSALRLIVSLIVLTMSFPVVAQTSARAAAPYPILIQDFKELRSAGIALFQRGELKKNFPHLKHRCYSYGDGGYMISISDTFLRGYEGRGFSLNSLCMGMISGIRFDPETGERIPTFIVVRPKKKGKGVEAVTSELTLGLPDCFKDGTPYSDCAMNFDPITGKKHKATTVAFYADLGREIEADFKKNKAAGRWKESCGSKTAMSCFSETWPDTQKAKEERGELDAGFLAFEHWPDPKNPAEALSQPSCCYPSAKPSSWQHQTNFDVSAKLPKGFGYALYATGEAGGDPDSLVLESRQSGSSFATSSEIGGWLSGWFSRRRR
jgi:hypothetical protein